MHKEAGKVRAEATRRLAELEARIDDINRALREAHGFDHEVDAPGLYAPRRARTLVEAMPAKTASASTPHPARRKLSKVKPRAAYVDRSQHPFPKAVGNVAAWADANGVPVSTARSWYTKAEKWGRPIPITWADHFLELYKIPHTAWPHGTTTDIRQREKKTED